MNGHGCSFDGTELTGRVALVTDAGSGAGATIAIALAEAGADVAVCDPHLEHLAATNRAIESLGRGCHAEIVDTDDHESLAAWITGAIAVLGPIDIVVGASDAIAQAAPVTTERATVVTLAPGEAADPTSFVNWLASQTRQAEDLGGTAHNIGGAFPP